MKNVDCFLFLFYKKFNQYYIFFVQKQISLLQTRNEKKNLNLKYPPTRRAIFEIQRTNGALRRWLDAVWKHMKLNNEHGDMNSRTLIPKYVDPRIVKALEKEIYKETVEALYNTGIVRFCVFVLF